MAKNKKSKGRRTRSSASAVAVATGGEGDDHSNRASSGDERAPVSAAGGSGRGSGRVTATAGHGSGFFKIYKSGQGYYTRVGTAVGAGLILAFGAHYIYTQIPETRPILHIGIPAIFLALTGLLLLWVVGINRTSNDFFIATEGEMKKVSWSTRGEVVGSTKVVLLFTLMMAVMLFIVDVLFKVFFGWIDVLQVNLLDTLFGGGSGS